MNVSVLTFSVVSSSWPESLEVELFDFVNISTSFDATFSSIGLAQIVLSASVVVSLLFESSG